MMSQELLSKMGILIELVKDGAQFAFHPVDETTGEIDLSAVGEDVVQVLRSLGVKIPAQFKVVKIVFDTN